MFLLTTSVFLTTLIAYSCLSLSLLRARNTCLEHKRLGPYKTSGKPHFDTGAYKRAKLFLSRNIFACLLNLEIILIYHLLCILYTDIIPQQTHLKTLLGSIAARAYNILKM